MQIASNRPALSWLINHPRLVCVIVLGAATFFALVLLYRAEHRPLTVTFLDVGQGDAILIEAPNGNQLLYDAGGPSGAVLRELGSTLPFWDRTIDVAVFSHPDLDHVGGFPEVFKRYAVDLVLEPGVGSDNGAYAAAEAAIREEGAAKLLARRGMRIELGGGAAADILYPDRDASAMETNAASIVMRIAYGDTALLLSGDLPSAIENYLAARDGPALRADILKLGHHGSRTSTSPYWLAAAAPATAVASAGRDNRYGHPHREVEELLASRGIALLVTAREGTITFVSDGIRFVRK